MTTTLWFEERRQIMTNHDLWVEKIWRRQCSLMGIIHCCPHVFGLKQIRYDGSLSPVPFAKTIPLLPCQLIETIGPIDGHVWVARDDDIDWSKIQYDPDHVIH